MSAALSRYGRVHDGDVNSDEHVVHLETEGMIHSSHTQPNAQKQSTSGEAIDAMHHDVATPINNTGTTVITTTQRIMRGALPSLAKFVVFVIAAAGVALTMMVIDANYAHLAIPDASRAINTAGVDASSAEFVGRVAASLLQNKNTTDLFVPLLTAGLLKTTNVTLLVGPPGQDGTSIVGPKGDKGDAGLNGTSIVGAPGLKGDKGDPGNDGKNGTSIAGPQGIKGDKGDKGEAGINGTSIVGPKGDTGERGFNGTFDAATIDAPTIVRPTMTEGGSWTGGPQFDQIYVKGELSAYQIAMTGTRWVVNHGGAAGTSGEAGLYFEEDGSNTTAFIRQSSNRTAFELQSWAGVRIRLNQDLHTTASVRFDGIDTSALAVDVLRIGTSMEMINGGDITNVGTLTAHALIVQDASATAIQTDGGIAANQLVLTHQGSASIDTAGGITLGGSLTIGLTGKGFGASGAVSATNVDVSAILTAVNATVSDTFHVLGQATIAGSLVVGDHAGFTESGALKAATVDIDALLQTQDAVVRSTLTASNATISDTLTVRTISIVGGGSLYMQTSQALVGSVVVTDTSPTAIDLAGGITLVGGISLASSNGGSGGKGLSASGALTATTIDGTDLVVQTATVDRLRVSVIESLSPVLFIGSEPIVSEINFGLGPNISTLNVGTNGPVVINVGNAFARVNIYGTLTKVVNEERRVNNTLIVLNVGGDVGSSGGVGFYVEEGGVSTNSFFRIAASRDAVEIKAVNGVLMRLDQSLEVGSSPVFGTLRANTKIITPGPINSGGSVTAAMLNSTGSIVATGAITAGSIVATGSITGNGPVVALTTLTVAGAITASSSVTVTGPISSSSSVEGTSLSAGATGPVSGGVITAFTALITSGKIIASGSMTAASLNVSTGRAGIAADGTISGSALTVSGSITATTFTGSSLFLGNNGSIVTGFANITTSLMCAVLTATGTILAQGPVTMQAGLVVTGGSITANALTINGPIDVATTIRTTDMVSTGTIDAVLVRVSGTLTAGSITTGSIATTTLDVAGQLTATTMQTNNLTCSSSLTTTGLLTATGPILAQGPVTMQSGLVVTGGAITANALTINGPIDGVTTIRTTMLNVSSILTAGAIVATSLTLVGTLAAPTMQADILTCASSLTTALLTATGPMVAQSSLRVNGPMTVTAPMVTTGPLNVSGALWGGDSLTIMGSIVAGNSVSAATVTSTGDIVATGSLVVGGASLQMTGGGTITGASQLTVSGPIVGTSSLAVQTLSVPGSVTLGGALTSTASMASASLHTTGTIVSDTRLSSAGTLDVAGVARVGTLSTDTIISTSSTLTIGDSATTSTVNFAGGDFINILNIARGTGATTINLGGPGDTVNVAGTYNIVSTTNTQVLDKSVILNVGGASGSSGGSGVYFAENGNNVTSFIRIASDRVKIELKGFAGPLITLDQSLAQTDSPTFVALTVQQSITATTFVSTQGIWSCANSTMVQIATDNGITTANILTGQTASQSTAITFGSAADVLTFGLNRVLWPSAAVSERKIALDNTANNDFQYVGFGTAVNQFNYRVANTAAAHIFWAGTSSTTASELFRVLGTGGASTTGPVSTGALTATSLTITGGGSIVAASSTLTLSALTVSTLTSTQTLSVTTTTTTNLVVVTNAGASSISTSGGIVATGPIVGSGAASFASVVTSGSIEAGAYIRGTSLNVTGPIQGTSLAGTSLDVGSTGSIVGGAVTAVSLATGPIQCSTLQFANGGATVLSYYGTSTAFTSGFTGVRTLTGAQFKIVRIGNQVTVHMVTDFPATSGCGSGSFTSTVALSADYFPSIAAIPFTFVVHNGASNVAGVVQVGTTGFITVSMLSGNFGGTCGFGPFSVTYTTGL